MKPRDPLEHTESLPDDSFGPAPMSLPHSRPRFDAQGNRIPVKVCTSCHAEKPLADFRRDRCQPDGLTRNCRPCRTRSDRKYRKKKHATAGTVAPLADALAAIAPDKLETLGRVLIELAQSCRESE